MSTLTYPTVRLRELDLGPCIGDGAEQACFELADSEDVVFKQVNYIEDGDVLAQNSTELAEKGLAPDVHAIVINDDDAVCGVIVDKCEVIEPLIEDLLDALQRNPLPNMDEDDLLSMESDLTSGEYWVIDDCITHGIAEVKWIAEEIDAFFAAAEDLKYAGLSDMHVFNVGIDKRGDYVCIDTCAYVGGGSL